MYFIDKYFSTFYQQRTSILIRDPLFIIYKIVVNIFDELLTFHLRFS